MNDFICGPINRQTGLKLKYEQLDMRLGYCTKHGSTTVCKDCTIEELRVENSELKKKLTNASCMGCEVVQVIRLAHDKLKKENTELIEWHERDYVRIVELVAKIDTLEAELTKRVNSELYDAISPTSMSET